MNSIAKKIPLGARLRALWHPLSRRLALTYFLLALVSVGGLIVWSGIQVGQATFAQQAHNLEIQAQLVANALGGDFDEKEHKRSAVALQQLVNTYAADHLNDGDAPTRITVVDEKLRVLASSDARVKTGREDNHPEFIAARAGFEQPDIRWDEFANEERIFVAAPIRGKDGDRAFAQLSMSTLPLYVALRQMWLGLLGAGALILALTTVVSWRLARGIAQPVQILTNASEAIARGDLARRVVPQGPDEIERLGRAFNRMTDQLQELIVREQEFAANAAHELRSPLTSLRLRLELLQNAARADSQLAARYVAQMERELANLQRMVEQLLALAALEQNGAAARAPLDLAPLLYELADEISPLVQEAQVQLRADVPIHLPPVHANAEQLRMAVRNLLDNALKYTPAHGVVTLHASAHADDVAIEVSDTGSGIPPDALPHIFERFYRTADARSNRVHGSGLGLALTRSLVEANGGEIHARSEMGAGSVFTIRLPQRAESTTQ